MATGNLQITDLASDLMRWPAPYHLKLHVLSMRRNSVKAEISHRKKGQVTAQEGRELSSLHNILNIFIRCTDVRGMAA